MTNESKQNGNDLGKVREVNALDDQKHTNSALKFIQRNPILFTILCALLIVVVVYVWKDQQGKNAKALVIKSANEQFAVQQQEFLLLLLKPMVWSIRAEMLRGNLEQVNILIIDLVKERNFQEIHLIEPDGNVLLSTNKRLEGQPAGTEIDPGLLAVESPVVRKNSDNMFVGAAPVMGVDRRIGVLIFTYQPVLFKL